MKGGEGGPKMEGGKRVPVLSVNKNRLGANRGKKDDDEEHKIDKSKNQQREEKGIQDLKWIIEI